MWAIFAEPGEGCQELVPTVVEENASDLEVVQQGFLEYYCSYTISRQGPDATRRNVENPDMCATSSSI